MAMTQTKTKTKAAPNPPAAAQGAKAKPSPIPAGMHTVTPHLVCSSAADAIAFYTKAFGGKEETRLKGPDGRIWHARMRIGDSTVMLVDEMPEWGSLGPTALKGTPVTLHLYVEDADAFVDRAAAAGAEVKMAVDDAFWGDRYGVIEDPFGHRWSVATHVRDMTPEEIRAAVPKEMGCGDAKPKDA
jgi:PhnB protein